MNLLARSCEDEFFPESAAAPASDSAGRPAAWPKGRHCGPAREKVGDERGRESIVQVRRIAVFARSAPVCAFARGGGETFADSTMTLSTDPEQGAGLFSNRPAFFYAAAPPHLRRDP